MSLFEKLLAIQTAVDGVVKDGQNTSDRYDFASSNLILSTIRPLMNEHKLLLIPQTRAAVLHEGQTRSGTTRYLTEITWLFRWVDVESGETYDCEWYSQGVDLAGEKGPGKAATYAEKYFLLKFFHVQTDKDDPDRDERTGSGEKKQRGTQAAKESADYMRRMISGIVTAISGGDPEKDAVIYRTWTESKSRGYAGADKLEDITDKALGPVYAKAKTQYKKRFGKDFELTEAPDIDTQTE